MSQNSFPVPSYPLEVEWIYHPIGDHKTGIKGIMYYWGIIQWLGDDTFSYYGDHVFKVTDERVREYLKMTTKPTTLRVNGRSGK